MPINEEPDNISPVKNIFSETELFTLVGKRHLITIKIKKLLIIKTYL